MLLNVERFVELLHRDLQQRHLQDLLLLLLQHQISSL